MAKQIITDEEQILKRKARRRLLGAIALTLLAVILLPLLLDNEPPPPVQDVELQIPDKDKAGDFVPKMVLPPTGAGSAVNAASAVPAPASAVVAQPASAPIAPLLDKPLIGTVPGKTPVSQPKVEVAPKLEPVHNDPAVKQPVAKPSASKPVKTEKQPAKKHAGFVLQVGAFVNADAAKKLHERLQKQGYASYLEKAGDKTRVRIGDFTTHAEAEKVQRKLEIQGMKPDVINLN